MLRAGRLLLLQQRQQLRAEACTTALSSAAWQPARQGPTSSLLLPLLLPSLRRHTLLAALTSTSTSGYATKAAAAAAAAAAAEGDAPSLKRSSLRQRLKEVRTSVNRPPDHQSPSQPINPALPSSHQTPVDPRLYQHLERLGLGADSTRRPAKGQRRRAPRVKVDMDRVSLWVWCFFIVFV